VTQLSLGSFTDMSNFGTEEEGNANKGDDDVNAVKYMYRDETWSQKFFTYDPKRIDFVGSRGTTQDFDKVPSVASLFDLFWPVTLLLKIVIETNRYASHPLDAIGNTMEGRNWVPITIPELKAFLAIHMYMGMKQQSNVQSYWAKEGSIFHYHTISNIMSRDRFRALRRCLHITDPSLYKHIHKGDPGYDKLRQVRWLVDKIRNACMKEWQLGKFLTIDEMMVRYKGIYCPIRQYMPKKPEKWGIKFWVLADVGSKFIYCFEIYCGKNLEAEVRFQVPHAEGGATYGVVMKLLAGLEGRGHCVVMDNYFCSVPLLRDLALRGIYGAGIVRTNRVRIPSYLKNARSWRNCEHGHVEWAMHDTRGLSCVMWKDK
jgi:hypothetical protein